MLRAIHFPLRTLRFVFTHPFCVASFCCLAVIFNTNQAPLSPLSPLSRLSASSLKRRYSPSSLRALVSRRYSNKIITLEGIVFSLRRTCRLPVLKVSRPSLWWRRTGTMRPRRLYRGTGGARGGREQCMRRRSLCSIYELQVKALGQ